MYYYLSDIYDPQLGNQMNLWPVTKSANSRGGGDSRQRQAGRKGALNVRQARTDARQAGSGCYVEPLSSEAIGLTGMGMVPHEPRASESANGMRPYHQTTSATCSSATSDRKTRRICRICEQVWMSLDRERAMERSELVGMNDTQLAGT
jgi:hypothetical protein